MSPIAFPVQRSYFIGIDSDGCAFDTMELKHKKVFIPQAIDSLGFEAIREEYRAVAERVNLYSRTRGSNRFEALATCLDELRSVDGLSGQVPEPGPLWAFVKSGRPLSNESFGEYVAEHPSEFLERVLHWSAESNRRIREMVVDNPPFAGVRTALETAHSFANTMVVSATPAPALEQEWGAAGLLNFIDEIAGQEFGPKREQLAAALRAGFSAQQSLMVGDAPGDHAAAEEHGIRFFPIVPGAEEESWRRFGSEAMPKFRAGTFDDAYQQALLDSYYAALDSHAGAPS